MTSSSSSRRLLLSLLVVATLGACASLPDVDNLAALKDRKATPTVTTTVGRPASKQNAGLVAKRWAKVSPDLKALAAAEEVATGQPLIAGNKVTLLFDGPATMKEMMAAVSAAKNSINLESYIFDQDAIGMQFADLLIAKRKQGVVVNVLYDAVGTLGVPKEFFDRMASAGITLLAFNPVNPAKRVGKWELNNRDHRKLMVVDGKIAFTGGINISSTYANSSFFRSKRKPENTDGKKVGWRDTHIKVEGPAVAALQWSFIDNWVNQDAGELPEHNYFPRLAPVGDKLVRVLPTDPDRESEIYKSFILSIQEAKTSVHITSAYFVPDEQFVGALCDAARRGVDVKQLLPGVTDHGLVFHAGRGFYDQLLSAGVKIFELQVAILHAKTAVIDSSWSTVGSANIDRRSFLHNYELNVVVIDPAFGRDMESAFNEDLRDSRQVTLEAWKHRPWADRLKELAARLAEYWI